MFEISCSLIYLQYFHSGLKETLCAWGTFAETKKCTEIWPLSASAWEKTKNIWRYLTYDPCTQWLQSYFRYRTVPNFLYSCLPFQKKNHNLSISSKIWFSLPKRNPKIWIDLLTIFPPFICLILLSRMDLPTPINWNSPFPF